MSNLYDYAARFRAALEWLKLERSCPDCGGDFLLIQDDGCYCWFCYRRLAKVEPNVSQWHVTKSDGTSEPI